MPVGSPPLHVAIIGSRGYPSTYGGFETFVSRLAPYLREQGARVTVYGHGGSWKSRVSERDGVVTIASPGLSSKSTSTLTHGASAAWHASQEPFDVALVLNVANGYFLPLLKRARIPTAVNVDGLEWRRTKWNRFGRAVFAAGAALTARWADELVADSVRIKDIWSERFRRSPMFIPYGADVCEKGTIPRPTSLGVKPGYLLVVARLVPENNIELFLDALDLMDAKYEAIVVGSANYNSPIVRRLGEAHERRAVRWLGHVEDQQMLASLWAHCGIYFHGHSVGGTNPALLQAMGYGAPVIAFDSPFNREVLGDNGTFVREPAALADAMRVLAETPERQLEMSHEQQRRIAVAYRWDEICDRYWRLLQSLAGRSDGRGNPVCDAASSRTEH